MNRRRNPTALTVISYDIVNNRRRNRLNRFLKAYGIAVQKSVFECKVSTVDLTRIKEGVRGIVHPSKDSVRYYTLCPTCRERIDTVPAAGPPRSAVVV